MNYKSFGKGQDIVFLHGWGGSISAFLFVAKRLSKWYRVTLVDFAGFGQSPLPEVPYTVKSYTQDVVSLLDELNIKSATFVAHSFGGRVALELATFFKERVNALVLIDSAGLKPRRSLAYYFKVFAHKLLKKLGLKGLKGSSDYRALSPIMKRTFVNVVNYDQTYLLPQIECPTAIFWGEGDTETPVYMARKLKKKIKGSQLFMLKGGHFSYADDYATFISILSAFLKETNSPKTIQDSVEGDGGIFKK